MFDWLKKKAVHVYHIVEVERDTRLPELTGDLKESLKALALHPGYSYLVQRLRHQKAAMQNSLHEGLQLTESQLRYLQAGIYWAGQLERDMRSLTQSAPKAVVEAAGDVKAEFDKIRSSIEAIV